MARHAIVLLFDDEQYDSDLSDGKDGAVMSREDVFLVGRTCNAEVGAGWYGYSSWIAAHDLPDELVARLAAYNVPDRS